ncbi:unnamed protein product [Closterium sp. Naga37s-1]|nr:unnamed protein product [Closterium sp. Naga37s-1]
MIAAVQAQVAALIEAADEIKTNNVREDHFTNVMARTCARQATIALRYLGQAGDAVEAGTNQLDVPYWLAAADTQIDNCVDGFQTFSPAAQGFPAYVHLEYTAKKAGNTLEALVTITNAAAKAAATSVASTEEDVAPVRGRRMAVRSSSSGNGAMDWLEEGLYEQLQELQTRLNAEFAAAGGEDSEGASIERRQLRHRHDDDDDDDDDEDKKDKKDKDKKSNSSSSKKGSKKSNKKSSKKKASPNQGPMVVSASLAASATVGSGYKSIQDAVDAAPGGMRFVIYIPAGTYKEQVVISTTDIVLIGAGTGKTIITGDASYGSGSGTFESATVGVDSDRFVAFGIKFVNTAGPENHQAVAFRATGDQTALFNCAFDGSQDTLYVDAGRQYYKNCYIGGSQDFIFGDAAVVIDAPKIQLHPSPSFGTLTASGRAKDTPTGIVIRDAVVSADRGTKKVYLGRPWKKCAFTVFINTFLPAVIERDGWLSWNEGSCMFLAEAGSKGPGAAASRADWVDPGIITSVSGYDVNTFTQVNSWLRLSR